MDNSCCSKPAYLPHNNFTFKLIGVTIFCPGYNQVFIVFLLIPTFIKGEYSLYKVLFTHLLSPECIRASSFKLKTFRRTKCKFLSKIQKYGTELSRWFYILQIYTTNMLHQQIPFNLHHFGKCLSKIVDAFKENFSLLVYSKIPSTKLIKFMAFKSN